ncbi:MAG: hypothetical protein ACLRFE_04030 [Clostridia bacterium]
MIIQNMIKHDVNDFYFATYFNNSVGVVSLLLKKDDTRYYDLRNHVTVNESQIRTLKPFSKYVQLDKQNISITEAKKLAKTHYIEFCKDCNAERKNNLSSTKTFVRKDGIEGDFIIG